MWQLAHGCFHFASASLKVASISVKSVGDRDQSKKKNNYLPFKNDKTTISALLSLHVSLRTLAPAVHCWKRALALAAPANQSKRPLVWILLCTGCLNSSQTNSHGMTRLNTRLEHGLPRPSRDVPARQRVKSGRWKLGLTKVTGFGGSSSHARLSVSQPHLTD